MTYEVSTPVYEGPFDLLLHLITKEQVNLYEISLSKIVDAFLVEIEKMQSLDLEVATEFLLIASTLVELKLRRLLPERANVEMDEELALLEERDLLLAKLLEYQTFRHAAQALRGIEDRAGRSYPRTNVTEERFDNLTPDLLASVTPVQLRAAFLRALNRAFIPKIEPRVSLDHVTSVKYTVADAVQQLAMDLPRLHRSTFRELCSGTRTTVEVIVKFLALLELFKQGWLELEQTTSFGELLVVWRPDGPDVDEADLPAASRVALSDDTVDLGSDPELDDPDAADDEAAIDAALASVRSSGDTEDVAADGVAPTADRPVREISLVVDDYDG